MLFFLYILQYFYTLMFVNKLKDIFYTLSISTPLHLFSMENNNLNNDNNKITVKKEINNSKITNINSKYIKLQLLDKLQNKKLNTVMNFNYIKVRDIVITKLTTILPNVDYNIFVINRLIFSIKNDDMQKYSNLFIINKNSNKASENMIKKYYKDLIKAVIVAYRNFNNNHIINEIVTEDQINNLNDVDLSDVNYK